MNEIDEMCAEVFLKDQGRLFDEPVAETVDEAMEFLEDCFAQVFNSEKELHLNLPWIESHVPVHRQLSEPSS